VTVLWQVLLIAGLATAAPLVTFVFGVLLWRGFPRLKWAGLLLALNGAACLLGVVGILAGNALLANGSLVGGVFFLLSLILFSLPLRRESAAAVTGL